MIFGDWLSAPRHLRLVFISVMLLLAVALGGLAWRLLNQDQQLALQRLAEQRDTAADLVAAALDKRLVGIDQDLNHVFTTSDPARPTPPAEGALFFQFAPDSLQTWPRDTLIFYPELPEQPAGPSGLFATADELEFKRNDPATAIAAARRYAKSDNDVVRAEALARIARNSAKIGQSRESIDTYRRLAELGPVPVGGMPAALAAGLAILGQQSDQPARLEAARAFHRELHSGRYAISSSTYQFLFAEVERGLPAEERQAPPRIALAEAVQWLWERWHPARDRDALAGNRASVLTSRGAVLLIWRVAANTLTAFAADQRYLEAQWLRDLKPLLETRNVRLALTNFDGHHVLGDALPRGSRSAVRLASATKLPWTIETFQNGEGDGAWRSRRSLLIAGMALLLVLILAGAWFIGRAVTHELAVAQLQSDFVSAVSHEFRTPLTSLCQLSELLMRNRVADESDRRQYYELLHNESHRLRRMVEALLNFGRLEANRMQFRFEDVDAATLVRQAAEEFEQVQQSRGCHIEVRTRVERPLVHADRETLRCVFWNLFENAVKYSPECDTVWVDLAKNGSQVEIAVRDSGIGIPPAEQRRIFEKFVRGSAAREHGIRGTGIGLAMARQIVRAHGGDITLESEPAKGSTFRVVLPVTEA